jgi:hypothetical protein
MPQPGTHFICFTSTKVQILTPEELGDGPCRRSSASASPQFTCFTTCFTSTEVQILTPELGLRRADALQQAQALALLVQKYKS